MNENQQNASGFNKMVEIVRILRGSSGCPWDQKQTSASLRSGFIQECYEVLDAIDGVEHSDLAEELGDVLLHIIFQALIAEDSGHFTIDDILNRAHQKLLSRHPHVFGNAKAGNVWEVEKQWEKIKLKEREGTGKSILDGIPKTMPALSRSQGIQLRASRTGFDWDDVGGVLDKINEEIQELKDANGRDEKEEELGDIFFTLVRLAGWIGVDAESATRLANEKFYTRFKYMEDFCKENNISFTDLPMSQKEMLWEEAKNKLIDSST